MALAGWRSVARFSSKGIVMFSMNVVRKTQMALSAIVLGGLLASCGQNPDQVQIVKDLQVQAITNDQQEILVSVDVELELGDMSLPSVEIPIINPQTGEDLGAISFLGTLNGTNELGIEVNLTNATKGAVGSGSATLPNGKALPIGGIDQSKVIAIAVPNTGIKVYIGVAQGMALLGVAVPIAQLDGLGTTIGGLNIFPTFDIKGIKGIAGLFTGTSAGQSGLALFVDLSKVIDPSDLLKGVVLPQATLADAGSAKARGKAVRAVASQKMFFYPSSGSDAQMDVIAQKLYQLHSRKAKLKVR